MLKFKNLYQYLIFQIFSKTIESKFVILNYQNKYYNSHFDSDQKNKEKLIKIEYEDRNGQIIIFLFYNPYAFEADYFSI